MKVATKREKWAVAVLALVCCGLAINVVIQTTGVKAGAPHAAALPVLSRDAGAALVKDPAPAQAADNSTVQLQLLEQLESRPLASVDRNPFEFGLSPAEKALKAKAQHPSAAVSSPPPAPAVTVKAVGFVEDKAGKRTAILADDQDTYQVVEGQSFAGRYKCTQITATSVEIRDESYHQTVQLPFPQ